MTEMIGDGDLAGTVGSDPLEQPGELRPGGEFSLLPDVPLEPSVEACALPMDQPAEKPRSPLTTRKKLLLAILLSS
jgi:hypothetical protein